MIRVLSRRGPLPRVHGGSRALAAVVCVGALWCACDPGAERRQSPEESPDPSSAAPPRLVVLISIDTLRADHLGLYGHERPTSPHLDVLGRDGLVFEDASAPAPWTLPSHASLLTGLYPRAHGVLDDKEALSREIPTLASMIAERGYATAAVVNSMWLSREKYGLTREFDRYLYVQEDASRRSPSTWVTDQALAWLDEAGDGRLFLFVHYYDVHADYASEPRFETRFVTPYEGVVDGSARQLRTSDAREAPAILAWCERTLGEEDCAFAEEVVETSARLTFDAAAVEHLEQLYDAGIRQMDEELGRFFAELRRRGLFDEALLIVTSDHGEEFMEHGRVSHFFTTYEEVLRVPLILRGPGIPKGVRVAAPVSLVDVVPTLLDLTGASAPPPLDGLALTPLWRGGDAGPFASRPLFGEASGGLIFGGAAAGVSEYASVRRGPYKLVHNAKDGASELYELAADPGEQRDVSREQPEIAARLYERLRARHAEADAATAEVGERVELDPGDVERLRALGYVP